MREEDTEDFKRKKQPFWSKNKMTDHEFVIHLKK